MEEKEAALQELQQQVQPRDPETSGFDLAAYETELNRYRQQLETDRAKLNSEIEQLRQRNQELDEATREMEMELSRERAELARERTRLDRMREEVKGELERVQRDGTMRQNLAPVHKLRDEITQRKAGNGAAPQPDDNLNDRLRTLRNRLVEN
jgi:hypothetical protein